MDQNEAADFVRRGLEAGHSCEQITQELSTLLKAPTAAVTHFVERAAAQQAAFQATQNGVLPRQPEFPPPPLDNSRDDHAGSPSLSSSAPLTYGSAANAPITSTSAQSASNRQYSAKPPPGPGRFTPAQPAPLSTEEQAALEKFVLKELLRNKERSDIIMEACEITGMNWADAQRLVARIATQNRKKLNLRQNMVIIPMSITAVLAGLTLTIAAASELYNLAVAVTGAQQFYGNPRAPGNILYLLGLGVILFLGGAAGLIRALPTLFE